MSEPAHLPPSDPRLRFRLRTIIAITTGVAVAAAASAPYFRRQSQEAQSNLVLFWSLTAVFLIVGVALWLWIASRVPVSAGRIHHWVNLRRSVRHDARIRLMFLLVFLAIAVFMAVNHSRAVVRRAEHSHGLNWVSCALNAMIVSLLSSQAIVALSAPIALCERGIPIYGTVTEWRKFATSPGNQNARAY